VAEGEAMKITQGRWEVGVSASDLEYAKIAYLYTETLITKSPNTNLILAMAMGVPISTVRERIRECRERGLITSPGKGKRGVLTLKACSLLEMEKK
jgi:predicted transcriptional regulator